MARDVAPVAGSLTAMAGSAVAGWVTAGPVGLVGCGTAAFAAVVVAHRVAWALRPTLGVACPRPMLPRPAPEPVAVTVEVVAEIPAESVSEPWPGVHVEQAARYA